MMREPPAFALILDIVCACWPPPQTTSSSYPVTRLSCTSFQLTYLDGYGQYQAKGWKRWNLITSSGTDRRNLRWWCCRSTIAQKQPPVPLYDSSRVKDLVNRPHWWCLITWNTPSHICRPVLFFLPHLADECDKMSLQTCSPSTRETNGPKRM